MLLYVGEMLSDESDLTNEGPQSLDSRGERLVDDWLYVGWRVGDKAMRNSVAEEGGCRLSEGALVRGKMDVRLPANTEDRPDMCEVGLQVRGIYKDIIKINLNERRAITKKLLHDKLKNSRCRG